MRCLTFLLLSGLFAVSLRADDSTKKLPVPDQAAQAKALALIWDIFKDDIQTTKDAEAKAKLAVNFLQQGKEQHDDPANRYVLLREARNLAAKAGDANLTLLAVDDMARAFAVDAVALKINALSDVANNVATQEAGKTVVDLVLPMMAAAVEADNYPTAGALGKVAETAARKSQSLALVAAVQKRNEEVAAVYKGFARLQAFGDRLKQNPNDAEANLELGKYYGLLRGRWTKALPLLALGNDAALKSLATRDLAQPKTGKDQLALADGWWELAQAQPATQEQLERRAMFWYEQAVVNLAGLNRTKALKRIERVTARLGGGSPDLPAGPVGELKKFDGHTDDVKSVALSVDGRFGASGSVDQSVRVWDLAKGTANVLTGHGKAVWGVAFHPNDRQLFSVSWDATARLWDLRTGNEIKRFTHPLDVNGLAVARDGNSFLTGSDDHNVYLWNTSSISDPRKFPGHSGYVYCVAFAADGRHIASGGVDKTVRVFDLVTGNQVNLFEGSQNDVTNVAFTPDSRYVLSSDDNVIHVWDRSTGKEVRKFEGHTGLVFATALSADGRRLLTGGEDKTIRLWDVVSGKQIHKFEGHTDTVTCVCFSSDGRRALSGSRDRSVRLWGLPLR